MKIILITNIPAPYRIPVYNKVSEAYGDDFLVVFCAKSEPNRAWNLPVMKFNHLFLEEKLYAKKDGFNYVHNNYDVISELNKFNPDVVITTGYNPTHLYAWLFSLIRRKKHIPMTDGWLYSEKDLSWLHKLIRKVVFKTSSAYIGASKNSIKLFESYGVEICKIFQSHLCVDNNRFLNHVGFSERPYHIMFSGAFHERKLPFFFAEVAKQLKENISDLKVLVLGNGELKKDFLEQLDSFGIDYDYAGYVKQEELPSFYAQAKLFFFTTKLDAWGLVANEALASGTPVITTPYAGVVDDLVLNDYNGKILSIDEKVWTKVAVDMLSNESIWKSLSANAKESVKEFNFENAAKGIIEACEYANE